MRQSRSNEHVQQKIKKNPFHSVREDEILASFKKMEQFEKDEDLRPGMVLCQDLVQVKMRFSPF